MSMMTRYYRVAGHGFCVTAPESDFGLMTNYEPFETRLHDPVFTLTVGKDEGPAYTEEFRQEEEGQVIVCGKTAGREPLFEFLWDGQTAGWLVCSADGHEARLIVTGYARKMAIDNALMMLYALETADKDTALFHAAVVGLDGRGYMFLGKSGTRQVMRSTGGSIGREIGKTVGEAVLGKKGRTIGGNIGSAIGRNLFGTLSKKK